MTLEEARRECRRYLDHCDATRTRSDQLLKLASDRKAGRVTQCEANRRMKQLTGPSPTVYDGARLEVAVGVLLRETAPKPMTKGGSE